MKAPLSIVLIISLTLLATPVFAKPILKVDLKAEAEVIETVDGKEVVKTVPVTEIASGQTIIYTLTVNNSGDQPATNVKLNDPIPEGTSFVVGSLFGDEADITYSIDGGKTYKKPTLLTYRTQKADGSFEDRQAIPDQYTHIQWLLEIVPAGDSRSVGFRALVK